MIVKLFKNFAIILLQKKTQLIFQNFHNLLFKQLQFFSPVGAQRFKNKVIFQ